MKRFDHNSSKAAIQKEIERLGRSENRYKTRAANLTKLLSQSKGGKSKKGINAQPVSATEGTVKDAILQALARVRKPIPTAVVVEKVHAIRPEVPIGSIASGLTALKKSGVVIHKDHAYFLQGKKAA